MVLLCWDMFLLFPFWWEFLSWIDSEFCQMLFLHLKMTMRFWSSLLLMYHMEWFVYIEPSFWPWNEFNLTMVNDVFFMNCWIQFAYFYWEFCILYSSKILACSFLFCSMSGFGIRVMVASKNAFECSFFFSLLE